ncbi:glycosyltransferase family 32 protein [Acetobacter sicerae]|uniref:glycosyltransferase family 32 protein n=1 Tax=Acetobacter sicerae TaxID=85325 RepID=UPI00156BA068|nr:capsular polysaccharide synthesis protein [Acetobacter sicerae]NHN92261.1 hypothetical protein [Acetobacter sicerae]
MIINWRKIRFWKDAFKSIIYGITTRSPYPPEFKGWTNTLDINPHSQSDSNIPKIVWFYWDQKEKPDLVRATIDRVCLLNPDHEVKIIDTENASEFVDASFLSRNDIPQQHKSDLIRLELLAKYGGIWSDATCIYNENFSWIQHISQEKSPDLIAYYRNKDTFNKNFPIIESWFLACPPNNNFITEWKNEFKKVINTGTHEYFNSLKKMPNFNDIKQGITRGEYLIIYFAAQVVMRKTEKPSFHLRRAEDSAFLYQDMLNWNREKIAAYLCRLRQPNAVPPVIKLTHSNRYLLPFFISHGLVKKNSILSNFLKLKVY